MDDELPKYAQTRGRLHSWGSSGQGTGGGSGRSPRFSAGRVPSVAWFALIDSRITRREFGHGDLFFTREDAEQALADVLKDEPQLEPFLSVEALPLAAPSAN